MEEIVKLVASKTGMSEAVAKVAVETVISTLKTKLPAGMGDQLDSFIGGSQGSSENPLGDIAGKLGGLFGN